MSYLDDMPDKEVDFLIARYKGLSEEIKFTKLRQWGVTYATLGLYAAIINFHSKGLNFIGESNGAIIVSILVLFSSLIYLCSCHSSLCNNDQRMDLLLKKSETLEKFEKKIKRKLCTNISCFIPFLHYTIVGLGLLLVVKIVGCK